MTNSSQHSAQFLRKRKFLLVLPLLVLPFVFIVFIALGGGRGQTGKDQPAPENKGFNMTLPEPHFAKKETITDKLGFYKKADEDSAKRLDRIRQDPYHAKMGTPVRGTGMPVMGTGHLLTTLSVAPAEDSTAGRLLKQLDQLKAMLHRPVLPAAMPASVAPAPGVAMLPARSPDIGRLEKLMQAVKAADTSGGDPQMDKLNGMLDKILKIQHPAVSLPDQKDTVAAAPATVVLPVTPAGASAGDASPSDPGGFYAIDEPDAMDSVAQNTLSAVVPEDQTLVAGATITLRLTQDASINGISFPRDNLLYGQVSINGDRMLVLVSSVRYKEGIYPVSLQVFDMDGLAGIHIPGAITRDVAKASADQGVSSLGLTALDPSLGAQAATAGIEAAKTLVSRKIRLVRVSVKAGYEVLLKNTKSKTH